MKNVKKVTFASNFAEFFRTPLYMDFKLDFGLFHQNEIFGNISLITRNTITRTVNELFIGLTFARPTSRYLHGRPGGGQFDQSAILSPILSNLVYSNLI